MRWASTTLVDFLADGVTNQFFCDSWELGFGKPTMAIGTSDWRDELGHWLKPFLDGDALDFEPDDAID
jgi:hypothetical protein